MMASEFTGRAKHHGTPDPYFAQLCDLADRVGMSVELETSAVKFGGDQTPYRNIVAIYVRSGDDAFDKRLAVTVKFGPGDDFQTMAIRALRELEARL